MSTKENRKYRHGEAYAALVISHFCVHPTVHNAHVHMVGGSLKGIIGCTRDASVGTSFSLKRFIIFLAVFLFFVQQKIPAWSLLRVAAILLFGSA